MKTPRELLFEKHRSAEARLDAVRAQVISSASPKTRNPKPETRNIALNVWRELFQRHRAAWATMFVLWLAIWGINSGISGHDKTAGTSRSSVLAMVQTLEEQRRLLAELLPPANDQPAEPPRPKVQPRSDRQLFGKTC